MLSQSVIGEANVGQRAGGNPWVGVGVLSDTAHGYCNPRQQNPMFS